MNEGVVVELGAPVSSESRNYSVALLDSYDKERHISLDSVFSLLKVSAPHLNPDYLTSAISDGSIHVYDFNGQKFLDRLDVGRVYHQPSSRRGLHISRHFTDGKTDPYSSAGPMVKKHLKITHYETGETIFEMNDAIFPESLDDVSAQIVAQKYFFKPSKPEWREKLREKIGSDHEFSFAHLVRRVTNFVADMGDSFGYFSSDADREAFRDELAFLQMNRMFAFNSPVQFNAGIYNEYGIEGSRSLNFWRDPVTGVVSRSDKEYVHPQCHACFIKGPRDSLESILKHVRDEGAIFSAGSGIGQDIGALRSMNELLSGGGRASGPLSFLKNYDSSAGTIKSGGKSRRAARMTTMRQDHPDVMKFIRCKIVEDRKALTLMKAGYSAGMDGDACATVAYQNTNLSVRLDDDFFEKLKIGGSIELRRVTDGVVVDSIPAVEMLKAISFGSWRIGDPAVQFETKIQEMHTCKNSGRINSSNPCSEYMFLDDTSCNLASTNLLAFSDSSGDFSVRNFRRANELITIALDILNDAASYPVEDIARVSPEFRTIGLGYANLGALLMRRGVAYASDSGRAFAAALASIMTGNSYEQSSESSENLGSFVHFDFNKNSMLDVIRKHQSNLDDIAWNLVPSDMRSEAYRSWSSALSRGERFGFRNAQTSLLAPTGTISFLMGCDTTGVEPPISLRIVKNLAGGGNVTLANREVGNALNNLGYSDSESLEICDYVVKTGTVRGAPHINHKHLPIFDTAFGNKDGVGAIPFEDHVRMLGAIQPFVSGAISKTSNLPSDATVADIFNGYILGHSLGLKALAVFRHNSKPDAALDFGGRSYVQLGRGVKEELPNRRICFESEVKIGGVPLHVTVSEYDDGRPGQIVFLSYTAGSTLQALLTTHGIMASKSLKRGVDLEDVVSSWRGQQFDPQGIVDGHPFIKMALSPLDFAAKFLLLEYKGVTDIADNHNGLELSKLRGAQNGAFRTFDRLNVDDWDESQVLADPELGGFVEKKSLAMIVNGSNGNGSKNGNNRGVACQGCGSIMEQTSPNCYHCKRCGDKRGGCGG